MKVEYGQKQVKVLFSEMSVGDVGKAYSGNIVMKTHEMINTSKKRVNAINMATGEPTCLSFDSELEPYPNAKIVLE